MSSFELAAFPLLGIERFLYGYIYHFPESFQKCCRGQLKALLDYDEGEYWQVAKQMGIGIKVFQFGVVGYDLLLRRSVSLAEPKLLCPGLAMVGLGQLLNSATFRAIGAKGVYYGSQLGYDVPWATGFPYNLGISDPQYWGVIFSVWGFYLCLAPYADVSREHFLVPWLETFWYITSMKLLEHGNGGALLKMLGFKAK